MRLLLDLESSARSRSTSSTGSRATPPRLTRQIVRRLTCSSHHGSSSTSTTTRWKTSGERPSSPGSDTSSFPNSSSVCTRSSSPLERLSLGASDPSFPHSLPLILRSSLTSTAFSSCTHSNLQKVLELPNLVASETHKLYVEFIEASRNRLPAYLALVRQTTLECLVDADLAKGVKGNQDPFRVGA